MSVARIAVVAGDGIGTEVTAQARKVIDAVLPGVEYSDYDLGARLYNRTGEVLPPAVEDELAGHDAILLGAIGDPSVPPGVLERGLLLKLRFDFDQYVNLRPSRLWPGTVSPLSGIKPGEIDMVVVREGTEGLYVGAGGTLHRDTPAEFADVTTEYQHIDAASMFMVSNPQRYDVVVTDNLFGDILTDIAAAVTGGIGMAASGSVNPERKYPSTFEPVHGSAPDIAGQGIADPAAAILSASLLLEHLGHADEARRVAEAVAAEVASRAPGAPLRTAEVGDRVAAAA